MWHLLAIVREMVTAGLMWHPEVGPMIWIKVMIIAANVNPGVIKLSISDPTPSSYSLPTTFDNPTKIMTKVPKSSAKTARQRAGSATSWAACRIPSIACFLWKPIVDREGQTCLLRNEERTQLKRKILESFLYWVNAVLNFWKFLQNISEFEVIEIYINICN